MAGLLEAFYPESAFGGFTDIDGTIAFYTRVRALCHPDSVVVDFGCGPGDWVRTLLPIKRQLRWLRGSVSRVIGLDVDPAAGQNPSIDDFRLVQDGRPWPLEASSVDLILCDNVLEHLAQPKWFFGEARRVLRRGGHLAIRTSNALSYVALAARLIPDRWRERLLRLAQPTREHSYPTIYACNTVWRLRRMLNEHGFDGVVYGYEAEPTYLNFSRLAYRLGVWHQRWAPRCFRSTLFAFARVVS